MLMIFDDSKHRLLVFGEIAQHRFVRAGDDQVEMDADHMVGVTLADAVGHGRPPVAALRPVALVAQSSHQNRPRIGDMLDPQPVWEGLSLKPYPGSDGQTTWNASAESPPWVDGSVSGPITLRNSMTEPGHPWVRISGTASGWGERTCKK